MHKFMINARELSATPRPFDCVLAPTWIDETVADAQLRAEGAGQARLEVYRSGSDVVVRGKLVLTLRGECARCLEEATLELTPEVCWVFGLRREGCRSMKYGLELSPQELEGEFFDGETVILDSILREQILLEIPMQIVCRADCEGLLKTSSAN